MDSTKKQNQQRQFFVLVGLALLSLGTWKAFKERWTASQICIGMGATLLVFEFLIPKIAKIVFRGWMKFAVALGVINTVIILSIIYWVMLVPLGLIGKRLSRKSESTAAGYRERKSSWMPLEPGPPQYHLPY